MTGMRHVLACLLCVALFGCEDTPPIPPSNAPDDPPKPEPRKPQSSARRKRRPVPAAPMDLDQSCSPAPDGAKPLDVLELRITSGLEDRKPTDTLSIIGAGTKVYAYLVVKNLEKTERCVVVTFKVDGKKRSALTLDIGTSPTWRTWTHITTSKRDAGSTVEIEVTDDQGKQHYREKVLVEP